MKRPTAAIVALALCASPALADKITEAWTKANEQFAKGKTDDAIKTLTKTRDQNQSSPEAHLFLHRMQLRTGALDEAADSIKKAVELSPSAPPEVRSGVHAAAAQFSLLRGSARDAFDHASKAVEAQATPDALAALAEAQVRQQEPAKALETAERAAQANGGSAAAQEARGHALLALTRGDEALAAFRKAVELDAKLTSARVGVVSALLAQGKAAEAVVEARKATEVDQHSGEAFAILGTAMLVENPKSWNDAIAQAQQGAFLNPGSPAVQYAVGKLFEAAGNLEQASTAYAKANQTDPSYVPARSAQINILVRKGQVDAALSEAQKLVQVVPGSPDAQLQLGRILLRKGDFEGAAEALEKSVKMAPNVAEAQAMLGTAMQYSGRPEEAYEAYKKATQLDPRNVEYKVTYGLLLGVAGQHEAGVKVLREVIATPGYKDADAHINLGWVYRNMKPPRTEESVAAYKKGLELDPKNAQAALGMGWAYSYSRYWDEAIGAFKRALELEPKVAGEALNGIAWCYFFKKDMPKAREQLRKAQDAGRKDPRLEKNIEKIEKLLAAGAKAEEEIAKTEGPKDTGPDLGKLNQDFQSKNAAVRRRAAQQFRQAGADGVPFLAYQLQVDKDIGVREAIVASLCGLGSLAKEAVPALKAARDYEFTPNPNATAAEMEAELREKDLQRTIKECLPRIER